MRHAWSLAFALSAAALSGGPAAAVTISYLEDLREIHARSIGRFGSDHGELTLQPSLAFSDFSTGIAFQQSASWQVSYLGPTSMAARGYSRSWQDIFANGSGYSLFHVVFSIDEAAPWTLSGVLEREEIIGYNTASARVVLSSGGSVIFSQALPANPCCPPGYYDPLSVPVLTGGELAAGQYELLIEATWEPESGISFFDFVFSVPEPHVGALLVAALAGALARGVFRRSR